MFFKSLISRVIILTVLLLTIGIGTFTLFHIWREQQHLLDATREDAGFLLTTVENSIFNSMRLGDSEDVQAVMEMVGRSPQLTNLRIFAPDGTILKSARPGEIGTRVNAYDLGLFMNGRTQGIVRVDGQDNLAMVRPIVSDARCFVCHGMGPKVIGVLDLNYSLAEPATKLRESSQFFIFSTAFLIVLLSGGVSLILLRFVKRPIQEMADKMSLVEAGDLSVRMVPRNSDEVSGLMRNFNSMVVNLEKAKNELEECHYRQMERADRLASVGEMASGIAHEIKNPLAGISGAISVLGADFAQDDERREIVNQVLEQISRLDKTATDLLSFGRPGKPEFSFVDINSILTKTLFFVSQHPEARNIHRVKELTRDLPPVWVDQKQIQQVLFNIILNAIQAMKEGGTLSIVTEPARSGGRKVVRVAVTDTGRGIPPDELDNIFVPFFTTKNQGTGLGLPICKQLLEQHGGTIRVESRIGNGSTFTIELPVISGQNLNGREAESA